MSKRILVTGGAGFVGANLCIGLTARHSDWQVVALDNLHRRGSELNLPRLGEAGVGFVQADVRDGEVLLALDRSDTIVECSAEPATQAGTDGDTGYAVHTNLTGAYNCLELARRDDSQFVFLSTSRVYPYEALNRLEYEEHETRFELADEQPIAGASAAGISEAFPLEGPRTLYGATKLAAELLVEEFASGFGLRGVVNRCGVIAGPWQMGREDQGVFAFWLLHHYFGLPLRYLGYQGGGKQVRDVLHIEDLVQLIDEQICEPDRWTGFRGNVGGGRERSLSLLEATRICRELTGNEVRISGESEARAGDVRIYLSDCALLEGHTDWRPSRSPRQVLSDLYEWVRSEESSVAKALGLSEAGTPRPA